MRDPVWNKIIGIFLATGAFYVTLKVDPPPPTVIFLHVFLDGRARGGGALPWRDIPGFVDAIAGVCLCPIHILLGAQ